MLARNTIERLAPVRVARARIAELTKQARALDAKAPPKPPKDQADVPAVDAAEFDAAERALDAGLDGQIHGAVSAVGVESLRQARDAARAKLTKGETERASRADVEQRLVAAFKRQKQPLMDEIGVLGGAVDDGMDAAYTAQIEEEAAALLAAERQLGVQAARVAALVNARAELQRRRAPGKRLPVALVVGAVIGPLPAVPTAAAYSDAKSGFVRLVLDPDPKAQPQPGDIAIDAKAIAGEMAREIEAELARL